MLIDRWNMKREVRDGRTRFSFQYGGDLTDFDLVTKTIVEQFGGKLADTFAGIYADCNTIQLPDHTICFWYESDTMWFQPRNDLDKELTEAFAARLKNALDRMSKKL